MDASALSKAAEVLRNSIAVVESQVSSFERFSNWAGLAVLIGCAIELCIIGHEYWDDLKAYRRNSIRTPEKPSGWLLFLSVAGISLVVLGIGGELWASLRVQRLQGELQGKNGELTQLFEGAFEDALRLAAKNEKEAGDARQKAEKVAKETEVLRKQNIESAKQRDKLAIEAELLRKANLELEASLLDRTFEDQGRAISALQTLAGTKATIEYFNERESRLTAEQINFVLLQAHWEVSGVSRENEISAGIIVSTGMKEMAEATNPVRRGEYFVIAQRSRPIVEALATELNNSNIEAATRAGSPDFSIHEIVIQVGPKPNHVLRKAEQDRAARLAPRSNLKMRGNRASFHPVTPPPK
jgi:hypothetical protein